VSYKVYSWDSSNSAWLQVDDGLTEDEAWSSAERRTVVADTNGIGGAAFFADTETPGLRPEQLGITLTVGRSKPLPRAPKPVGKDQPGARQVRLQVLGHVDDDDMVWFGSMCWPRDIFEAGGGKVIEL
jgi:hypothetical protein